MIYDFMIYGMDCITSNEASLFMLAQNTEGEWKPSGCVPIREQFTHISP